MGAVRTSVTLLGQDMGNTLLINGYTFSVSFAVLFGQIAALFSVLSKRLSARILDQRLKDFRPDQESGISADELKESVMQRLKPQ